MERSRVHHGGFTLIEVLLGVLVLVIAIAAILGSYMGQVTLTEHARNLSMAINDANRVIEAIRQQNSQAGCNAPTAAPPTTASYNNWDAWLSDTSSTGGGGRSMIIPGQATLNPFSERIVVSCRNTANSAFCIKSQVGPSTSTEWQYTLSPPIPPDPPPPAVDPMQVTVAVCWRHRGRVFGQCEWDPTTSDWKTSTMSSWDALQYPRGGTTGVIDSPAMLTTVVTCRSSS